jgi:hypothetical protein
LLIALGLSAFVTAASAQSDLDAFMAQVLARRDDNWARLQQYVLDEHETFQITALDGHRVYGFSRDYNWFPRDGIFVRSPTRVDGVSLSEADRRKAEQAWLEREAGRGKAAGDVHIDVDAGSTEVHAQTTGAPGLDDLVTPGKEPRFVSSAYFMRFKFDPGHYALAGREKLLGQDVLRIEYYPSRMFQEGRTRPARELRDEDARVEAKMNKAALVTLWIEPSAHQILQYEFANIDWAFLPARSLARIDDVRASMKMAQPFPGVWLPDTIAMGFRMTLAIGEVAARYEVRYHDYRLAEVRSRIQ